jgi:hypothetical protein
MAAVVAKRQKANSIAVQELRGKDALVSIQTNDRSRTVGGEQIGELRSGKRRAQLWRDTVHSADSFTIVWREGGVRYVIGLVPKIAIPLVSTTREQATAIFDAIEVTSATDV